MSNDIRTSTDFIRWFDQVGMDDVGLVGGKNASLADQFAEIFDGFSIGSNDLTQVTLGIGSISLTPDAILKTTMHVLEIEDRRFEPTF